MSAQAHAEAARAAATASHEFAIEAAFLRATTAGGLRSLGYPSIVAAGPNAATLHYERNDSLVRRGDLVLMDAGAEFRHGWGGVGGYLPNSIVRLCLCLSALLQHKACCTA